VYKVAAVRGSQTGQRTEHVSGAEIGAEQAENQVSGSGAASWHDKIQWSRSGWERSGDWAEMATQNPLKALN